MLEREYQIPECRVLYSATTGFAADAPADVLARPLIVDDSAAPLKPDVVGAYRRPEPRRIERPAVQPREVPEKPKNVQPTISVEEVRRLRDEGKNVKEIAGQLGFTPAAIYKRMKLAGERADRSQLDVAPTYGWLEVIGEVRREGRKGRIFACRCKCGALTEAAYKELNGGSRTSCGCKRPQKLALNPERVTLACALYRQYGVAEASRRLGIGNTMGVYRLLAAGGVDWKSQKK